jgi:hypothetical protein
MSDAVTTDISTLPPMPNGTGDPKSIAASDGEVVDAPPRSKDSWLNGAGDLREVDIPVASVGDTVTVRGLSAGQLAFIQDRCRKLVGDRLEVDTVKMAAMKFAEGVIDPKFSEVEANMISHKWGPAFDLVVSEIDHLTRATPEDIEAAKARFRPRR